MIFQLFDDFTPALAGSEFDTKSRFITNNGIGIFPDLLVIN